jgi:hypothetical protein
MPAATGHPLAAAWSMINHCYNVGCRIFWALIHIMLDVKEQTRYLAELGNRLKAMRLGRNDTMAIFAQRLAVSAGTLRAMEHGAATVQIGAWVKALWVLDHLDDLNGVLANKESLLEQARAPRARSRQRASRRP